MKSRRHYSDEVKKRMRQALLNAAQRVMETGKSYRLILTHDPSSDSSAPYHLLEMPTSMR